MPTPAPVYVVCDRCRAEGQAGEDPFEAFGALLDFDPVPRRTTRADGWDSEVQRAFIAALSLTGSDRQAARVVGKAQFGVTQLLSCPGSESFAAARDEALAMAADERSRRLAEGLRAVAAEQAGWRPAPPPWANAATRRADADPSQVAGPEPDRRGPGRPPARPARPEPTALEMGRAIARTYMAKLAAERRCRLEGRIAEADLYLRQLTFAEIAIELATGDAVGALEELRRGDHGLFAIAETDISRALDAARRIHWKKCGEPPRPEPPRHLFVEHDGYSSEPTAGPPMPGPVDIKERWRRNEEQHARDAQAHIEWEAEARRDYERRRASPRDSLPDCPIADGDSQIDRPGPDAGEP